MARGPVPYNEAEFPLAQVPALPVWSSAAWTWHRSRPLPGVLSLPHRVQLHSGRYALALALAHAGLQPGDRVLLPAYHCLAMVEPLRLAGLEPVYYQVRADLTIDAGQVAARIGDRVKALLAVHWFGVVQDLSALRGLADRRGLILVEDCAHTLFGEVRGAPVGALGDYAIASTLKFFALGDGGVLASAQRDLSGLALGEPSLRVEVEAIRGLLSQAIRYKRLGPVVPLIELTRAVRGRLRGLLGRADRVPPGGAGAAVAAAPSPEYAMEPAWLRRYGTRTGRWLLGHVRMEGLAARRRACYDAYLSALAGRDDCRPLFPDLPPGVVPQVFALHVTRCLPVFVALKRQGVPIIRFGEFLDAQVDAALCPVSLDYADRVLQFPCHQDLRDQECAWICERLVLALDQARDGRSGALEPAAGPLDRAASQGAAG